MDQPVKIYNFEVEDWHTYFVSESGILVHNTTGGQPCGAVDSNENDNTTTSVGGSLSIWSTSKNKNSLWNKGKLKIHFENHGFEVGANTSAEYSKMALEFGTKQSPNIIQAENGSFLYRFDLTTNEIFAGTKSGGKIKTYYIWDRRTDDAVINYFKETGLWN